MSQASSRISFGEAARALLALEGPAAVSAGAGAGKTTALVELVVRLLSGDVPWGTVTAREVALELLDREPLLAQVRVERQLMAQPDDARQAFGQLLLGPEALRHAIRLTRGAWGADRTSSGWLFASSAMARMAAMN